MLIENKGCQLTAPASGWVYPACLLQIACFFELGAENDWGMPPTHRFPADPEQTQPLCVREESSVLRRGTARGDDTGRAVPKGHFPASLSTW